MSLEVTVNEQVYKVGKLNVFQQLHVAKRLTPLLAGALPAWLAVAGGQQADVSAMASALLPLADAIARLSDEDLDYVVRECLLAVERKHAAGWARVRLENGPIMFDDLDLLALLQLTKEVVQSNLGNFFPALGRLFSASATTDRAASSTSPTT